MANRSSDDASRASADSSSAWRSRCRIWVELGADLEAELLAGNALDLGLAGRIRADGAGELADAQAFDCVEEAFSVTVERERPPHELEPERRRLRVNAVRASHAQRLPVLFGAGRDGVERPIESLEHDCARILYGERERRVEHVRGGQPEMEPPALLAEPFRDGVDERCDVVVGLALDLGHALRSRDDGVLADRGSRLTRHRPDLHPPVEGRQFDFEPTA